MLEPGTYSVSSYIPLGSTENPSTVPGCSISQLMPPRTFGSRRVFLASSSSFGAIYSIEQ
ncbi:hypothetical protein TRIATDRAFT_255859 [Trichoderma atroviride IMI 206040]|uniref:Uncharacterized protein n=1 Tax=Hypocrea atroviridis (strain ATCC 20476 / IMI 206040) TaxID=452589 RepID=G9NPA7_HYPAI|nr:uncharacterized protein TRIATDRAFT_255859 [Trichoderma atroviride IMI 206040]EHK47380.1 hypothetical protein TRIATDRAFT_255859 [Trichoderma atroviride IMI 206040]